MGNAKETKKAQMIGSILIYSIGKTVHSLQILITLCAWLYIWCDIFDSLRHVKWASSHIVCSSIWPRVVLGRSPVNQAQTTSPLSTKSWWGLMADDVKQLILWIKEQEGQHSFSGREAPAQESHFKLSIRRSPGEGDGNPLQYSCLENPMDRGAWWATVYGGHKESDMTEGT